MHSRILPTLLGLFVASACAGKNAAFCDEATPCADPAQVCDLDLRTCADPPDAAPGAGCGPDAPCTDPERPSCNTATGVCEPAGGVECDDDHPCADATAPICDPESHTCVAEPGAPTITQLETTVRDEAADGIAATLDSIHHTHQGAVVALRPGVACPTLAKHPHLLAREPQAVEDVPNPLRFSFTVLDADGVDLGTIAYRIRHPPTAFESAWLSDAADITATEIPGGVQVDVTAHRDAVPELGQRDGLFEIEVKAADPGGLAAAATACVELERLPAPVLVFDIETPSASGDLAALTLASDDDVAGLLNGLGNARIVTVAIEHRLAEDVVVRVGKIADLGLCHRTYRRRAALLNVDSVDLDCNGGGAGCTTVQFQGFERAAEACRAGTAPATSLELTDATGAVIAPCEGCGPGELLLPAAIDGPRRVTATVRLTSLVGMRPYPDGETAQRGQAFSLAYLTGLGGQTATSATMTGRVSAPSSQPSGDSNLYLRCLNRVNVGSLEVPDFRCRSRGEYRLYRAVTATRLEIDQVGVTVERRVPGTASFSPAELETTSLTWQTAESAGLPPINPP